MQRLLIRRDTSAWRLQVWASFGAAVLLCAHAVWNLPGESLDRLLVALGLFFVLSASFTLAKTVRDNQHEKVDTAAWVMQVWTAFAISTVLTGWAILRLAVATWHQGYLAASALFLLPSARWLAAFVIFAALIMHLFLDVLTSFGTCLFYPFSKYRVSLKSHFIVDPVVLAICIYFLISKSPLVGLVMLAAYVALSWLLKAIALVYVRARMPAALKDSKITLEPALLAPFRWLAIIKREDGYVFASLDFFILSAWHHVPAGNTELLPLARANGLLSAVLDTFEFPVMRRVMVGGDEAFVLEDVKWWTERPFRPLAFSGRVNADASPKLIDIVQGGFFVREHRQHAYFYPPERYTSIEE